MERTYQYGECSSVHYFGPGKNLDDLSLKRLHNTLVKINEQSGAHVVHKMLDQNLSMLELREALRHCVIGLFNENDHTVGFLISPLLKNNQILHIGLMVVAKNPGGNVMVLLALGNCLLSYDQVGAVYLTNISSTPSAIESFCYIAPDAWPGPDVPLKSAPRGYREIIRLLKDEYMDRYFPDPHKLAVDYKRFTLTSNSAEMGFKTDFHKVSRAENFKYNIFCHTWISYEKEEDIIQVAHMTFMNYLRMRVLMVKESREFVHLFEERKQERFVGEQAKNLNKKKAA